MVRELTCIEDEMQQAVVTDVPEVLDRIKNAFEIFDDQSLLLQDSFVHLRQNLADANEELNHKNEALSGKVQELEELTSRLNCIQEGITDGVLVVNDQYAIERCNHTAEELLGLNRNQIEGGQYDVVMNGLGNLTCLKHAIESGQTTMDEQRSCTDTIGRKTIVLVSSAPIRSADGRILGAVEVFRDVTRLRSLEKKVQHQERMVALGEMAASVAHEIRNPLGTIEGFARLLRNDLDKDELAGHSRLAGKIIEGAQNLNYVITTLLTYARPMSLQCEFFDVNSLLSSVRDILSEVALTYQVKLELTTPEDCPRAFGDVRQIRQVLVNLGRNAVEACEPDGTVSIRGLVRSRATVWMISDDGIGIPSHDIPKLFDPFFTRKEGGTGLGLSLCHKIIGAHGGDITVSSKEGSGTIFKVILPQPGEEQ